MRLFDYTASANCLKVRILAAQLGLDLERVPIDIFAGETLTDDYLARNPAGETPAAPPAPDRGHTREQRVLDVIGGGVLARVGELQEPGRR